MAFELAHWRLFLAVADHGSLVKAAEVLHTDQPALSRSLRRFERLLGGPLFLRSSRGLTLTDLGRDLLAPARALVEAARALEALAHSAVRRSGGILRVGAVDLFPINAAIAQAGRECAADDRPTSVEVLSLPWLAHPRALLDRVIDVGFDLVVDGQLLDPAVLRSRTLWPETQAFAVMSDQHPLADADPIGLGDLAELPLHLPDRTVSPAIHDLILDELARAGVRAPLRAQPVDTMAAVIAQIVAGHGWLFSAGTLGRHVPPGLVAKPVVTSPRHQVHCAVVWHVDTDPTHVDSFVRHMSAALDDGSTVAHLPGVRPTATT